MEFTLKKNTRIMISLSGGVIGMIPAITRSEDMSFVFIGFFLAFGLTLLSLHSFVKQHKSRRRY